MLFTYTKLFRLVCLFIWARCGVIYIYFLVKGAKNLEKKGGGGEV